ncbi:MAG: transposase [Prevotella pallens]|uniref:transposase n=1 Tax=Prevotella pallens TaxID=60133 RepID=UPI001CAB72E4|nr:transposase [Prevotella pallens]MBF1518555.1 transposase [Prevotella pallens]
MLKRTSKQLSMFSSLEDMLSHQHPLFQLSNKINWECFENAFSPLYCSTNGRPAHPIRLMCGLLILKHLRNVSDEMVVFQWSENAYYQYFCGGLEFMPKQPCDASELVHFRNRIGEEGMELILAESIRVNTDHDNEDHFDTAFIDSTVQEKNITYPTDAKLHKKIIKNVLKIVHDNCLPLRQSYTRTLKGIYRSQRFRNHPKNRKKALKADCKRAGIEPTIGHLKADHRLSRNFYKGVKGDAINVLLAAAAYNFKRAMRVLLYLIKRISIELDSTGFMLKYSF